MKLVGSWLFACHVLVVSGLAPQVPEPSRDEARLTIRWSKPSVDGVDASFLTSVLGLSGRYPVSESMTLLGRLPLAYFDGDPGTPQLEGTSAALGNPYVGIEIRTETLPVSLEVGLGLPLGANLESSAGIVGQGTAPENFEAFTDYDLSGRIRAHYRRSVGPGVLLHTRAGLSGGSSFARDGGPSGFTTLDYGLGLGSEIGRIDLAGEASGRFLLGGRTFHMSRFGSTGLDRFAHLLAVSAGADLGPVRPGLSLGLIPDDYVNERSRTFVDVFFDDEIDLVFGLTLEVGLP